jgi:putative ATP-dependent endonuclease of OLD family
LAPNFTKLEPKNYEFLQRFLDSTKANLFFARGVILVEGDAENLLIPTIAEIIGRPLHKYGVSIVNIGSTAFSHYEKIFERTDGESIDIRVAIITDLDVKPLEWFEENKNSSTPTVKEIDNRKLERYEARNITYDDINIKRFVSPNWTLEYELAMSPLCEIFYESVLLAEKKQNSSTGSPSPTKEQEAFDNAKKDFESWKSCWSNDGRYSEKVAYKIYKNTLLDKEISKAIVSQEFAARLLIEWKLNQDGIRNRLLRPPSLQYLINAICHVTEPLK